MSDATFPHTITADSEAITAECRMRAKRFLAPAAVDLDGPSWLEVNPQVQIIATPEVQACVTRSYATRIRERRARMGARYAYS